MAWQKTRARILPGDLLGERATTMYSSLKKILRGWITALDVIVAEAPMGSHDKIRLKHYAVFVGLGVMTMVVFCLHNFVVGNFLLGALIFLVGSSLMFGWLLMCYLPLGQIVYRANALLFGGLLLYMVVIGGEGGSKSLWLFTYPLIVFFLMGKREGVLWSGGILCCTLGLLLLPVTGMDVYPYGGAFILRLAVIYLLIAVISFWFEYFRDSYRLGIEVERQKMLTEISGQQQTEASLLKANRHIRTILDNIHAHVYVADPLSHKILFMNRKMKEDFGGDHQGKICWQVFRNAAAPCKHCTIPQLFSQGVTQDGTTFWEGYNPLTKRWYANVDQIIEWDEQPAKLQIAVDITAAKHQKKARYDC
jgi:PAS domain-containing protein